MIDNPQTPDPTPETARALLYRHGLPEDVIDGALCLHAQELAAVQREALTKTDDPVFYEGEAGWLVDLIDPTRAYQPAVLPAVPVPPTTTTADSPSRRAGLRDEIAEALIAWTYRGKDPEHGGILETVRANAYGRADAVLAVLYREWPWLRAEAEDVEPVDRAALRELIAEAIAAKIDGTEGCANRYRLADAVLAVLPPPADRAAVLREAEAEAERQLATVQRVRHILEVEPVLNRTALEYRGLIASALMADEAQQPDDEALHAKLDDATATLRRVRTVTKDWEQRTLPRSQAHRLFVEVRDALAGPRPDPDTETPVQHAPGTAVLCPGCRARGYSVCMNGVEQPVPGPGRVADEGQPETDEQRADREETERDHVSGNHEYCGVTCEAEFPTTMLRNGILAKGYPGTAGMLDELLRRARTGRQS